jgi:class 3 adenylate cyclase/ActR/RegA family two-component response regulator
VGQLIRNWRQKGIDMSPQATPVAETRVRKRVLVVDDSFVTRNVVRQIVESDPDLEVVDTAENGLVALKKVTQMKPDVVLLDIEMPEMSGLETLRQLGLRSPCKVVILSNYVGKAHSAERTEALRLGAVAAIAKPSGSAGLDLRQMRESNIVTVLRKTLGLPPLANTAPAGDEDQPLRFVESVDFSGGRIGDQLLDGIEAGVLVFSPEGSLVRANPAARRILHGWDLPPNVGTAGSLDEFSDALGQEIWDAIGAGQATVQTDVSIAKPNGERISVRRMIQPIVVSGKRCGTMVLLDDVARKRQMQALLERTMSSGVPKVMIDNREPAPGGAMREATVLFADIRGFTALAEGLGARRVVDLLNDYFSYMADVIGAEGGVIDKHIGDAIMVLFGVPRSLGDDADRAVAAARRMHRALKLMNELRGGPTLSLGIGLGSGPVIAGQIGAHDRMSYTVIGDPANLASRIERVTRVYGSNIFICGETFRRLARAVPARKVDVVILPGRETATVIYEVFVEAPGDAAAEWLEEFDAGFRAYEAGDFATAQQHFACVKDLNPDDQMAAVLAQRCRRLVLRSPGEWTGAWKVSEG